MFGYRLGKGGTSLVLAVITFAVPALVPTARSLSFMATAAAAVWCWTLVRLRRLTMEPPYARSMPSRETHTLPLHASVCGHGHEQRQNIDGASGGLDVDGC